MAHHIREDFWYLLNRFHGLDYSVLFVLGLIWLRLLLQVVEDAIASRRKPTHRFVHPLPTPANNRPETLLTKTSQPGEVSESDSAGRKDICA
jgi:hypothetical protein